VLSGRGSTLETGKALRVSAVSPGTVFVVADRVVSEAGLLTDLVEGLAKAGFSANVFDEIAGEPDDGVTMRAVGRARAAGAVAVVGIGGGSALDVAKIVALLVTNDGEVSDWLGVIEPSAPVAPMALVPTTTGTGSEATRISMITIAGAKRVVSCAQFVPQLAVLDANLVADLPAGVVGSTGMDALAHAVESMLSTSRSWFSMAAATQAIEILRDDLEVAALRSDVDAKGRVLYAAHLAGLALNAGVVLGHSLAYVIARHAPMPHGTSCAIALPYCLAYNSTIPDEVGGRLARTVTGRQHATLEDAAETVAALSERLDQPTSLAMVGIDRSELDTMVTETIEDYPRPTNPVPFRAEPLLSLYTHMHGGDLAGLFAASVEVA
jgi:alcohol dehydrogenase class IV